jgi:Cys-tRNA(Pro)/Cys-tRNA(Cys) deacylase
MPRKRSNAATPAIRDLETRGVSHQLHVYDFDPGDLGIGEQAAVALGIDASRLFKTLMVMIDGGQLAVALAPVDARTQMTALASALGGKRAAMATVAEAERASGYVKGGISPFVLPSLSFTTFWLADAANGTRHERTSTHTIRIGNLH